MMMMIIIIATVLILMLQRGLMAGLNVVLAEKRKVKHCNYNMFCFNIILMYRNGKIGGRKSSNYGELTALFVV